MKLIVLSKKTSTDNTGAHYFLEVAKHPAGMRFAVPVDDLAPYTEGDEIEVTITGQTSGPGSPEPQPPGE